MGHDGQELVQAGPWDGPERATFSQLRQARVGRVVPRGILAMGVHEEIRIKGDHPPRPSYATSRMRSHGTPATLAWRPVPLKVALRSRKAPACLRSATMRRNPSSTRARNVVPSWDASFRTSSNRVCGISTVVFILLYVSLKPSARQPVLWGRVWHAD